MFYRLDRDLKGKELSAHTLAAFMVLQRAQEPGAIRAGALMPAGILKRLIRPTAFNYWKKNGWLDDFGEGVCLSQSGEQKVADRLHGRDRAFSVDASMVLQMADLIVRGASSPMASGEPLQTIAGEEGKTIQSLPAPARDQGKAAPKGPNHEFRGEHREASLAQTKQALNAQGSSQPTGPGSASQQQSPSLSTVETYRLLEDLGRVQLSPSFFMRDFLYSEIAYAEGIVNIPVNTDLAIEAGTRLCERVLEPLQQGLGRIAIRSGYRSPAVNAKGAENGNQYRCSSNQKNRAAHIWDVPDDQGRIGATACIVVPSFLPYYRKTGDWTALAWWIYDHVTEFHSLCFFPKLAAFNIRWLQDAPKRHSIKTYVTNPNTGHKKAIVSGGIPTLDEAGRSQSWKAAFSWLGD